MDNKYLVQKLIRLESERARCITKYDIQFSRKSSEAGSKIDRFVNHDKFFTG